ncbi:hypothetical protein BKG69_23000 [Mycobacteroides chelonae]|uniref:DUF6461 domain-containing protein n=1 Tax=Mycobacteroides TaxID=670516 RepID=UPI0007A10226|nr:DUF6461 domain-containing protein [Mycobacteroides chelonae]AMW18299.1 hypothetical protein Chelonae_p0548 [Mycobacterium sp. QIA-37]AYM40667.1 hypothetical protein DYE20_03050 [[Mycobacterium] chelonae subsp. gwanakae]OHT77263.1 hypothetical protein BKG69_23000 [Mycobacteroides chelonae]OHU16240.1 hypothetical protein BKG75_14675 [Mycobacteroides chelonae]
MAATLADYAWWSQWRPDWAEAYCVTLISGITAEAVITSLEAIPTARLRGIDALYDRDVADWTGGGESSGELIGVADIDDGWALIAEINGYVGVTERLIEPMSVGRTVVSHFRNVNAAYRFHWWRDGTLLVDVDLLFPAARFGADPDALAEDIRDVGIPLDRPDDIAAVDLSAAGFALAQRITNVTCTPELFECSDFLAAYIRQPGDG